MYHARSTLRRATTAAAVAAVAAGLITAGPAAFAEPANSPSATDLSGQDPGVLTLDGVAPGPKTITLITGDTATLTNVGPGQDRYSVDVDAAPRPDGHVPTFQGSFDEATDAVYLYPDDARAAVESGVLDRDLFNLTYLAENGYTDAEVDSLPVIAQYPKNQSMRAMTASADALPASEPEVELSSIHASGLDVSKGDAGDFWSAIAPTMAGPGLRPSALPTGISKLWLDHKVSVSLDESVPMIGAPEAWDLGFDGTGVTVAILDTGYDENHPDLAGKVVAAKGFSFPLGTVHDGHGHGTHVASTIAGSGAASDGRYKGVAPGVDLMIGKVLNDTGQGVITQVIAGMEWAATNGADIISMSLGGTPSADDPTAQAVDELTESTGALFVVAAGNNGPTITSPGIADSALTVAAVDKSDQLAGFSNKGPTIGGSLKPDIAAPGVEITAARSAGTDMGGGARVVDEFYDTASGTSMATPHVAGAAAILVQQHPDWTPAQLKAALMSTSVDDGYTAYEQGAGRVDIARAVDQTVFATTPNADFGMVAGNAEPASRQITYRNTGDQDVTLTLTPSLRQHGGDPIPDGALSVDGQVSVPAGGTATATVTLNPADLEVAMYSGAIVATDETTGIHLSIPVGLQRNPPMHTLTINVLDRDGQPWTPVSVGLLDVTHQLSNLGANGNWVSTGVFETPVPEGVIHVDTTFHWIDESARANVGYLVDPEVEVTGDTEITLDARDLEKFTFNTSRPAEPTPSADGPTTLGWERTLANGLRVGGWNNANYSYKFWATPTEPVEVGALQVSTFVALAAPEVTMRVRGAPDLAIHPMMWPHNGTDFGDRGTGELFTGTQTLKLVDVGLGRPEDLAGLDLTGKLALLDNGGRCDIPFESLRDLSAAGAAGVVAYPSDTFTEESCLGGNPLPLGVAYPRDDSDRIFGVPYVSIAPGEGLVLRDRLAQDQVRITVTGTPVSPYVYEVTPIELDQVPDSLTYDLTDRHVARVDTEFHASEPTVFEPWWFAYTFKTGLVHSAYPPRVTAPATRTRYVGPLSDQVIHQSRVFTLLNGGSESLGFYKANVYDRPARTHDVWNGVGDVPGSLTYSDTIAHMDPGLPQIQHPNFAMCPMCREGDEFYPVFHHAFGTREYQDGNFVAPSLTHLYQGDQEIPLNPGGPVNDGKAPSFTVPSEPGDFRLTLEDPTVRTQSEWTFHSQGTVHEQEAANGVYCPTILSMRNPDCRAEPLVYATYDLGDRLGLDNKVRTGVHLFTINAYHAPSRTEMPRIAGARLWYSVDDGEHWIPALTVPKGDGEFQALAIYPPTRFTTGAVSLKLQAWDRAGNTLTQTTTRAFELRDRHTRHTGLDAR